MRLVVVSTYPKEGSRNIGDRLIELCTASAANDAVPGIHIDTLWRATPWEQARPLLEGADHVVFACLAIRRNLNRVYPILEPLLDRGVSFSVISAGTSLRPQTGSILDADTTAADLVLLKRVNDAARVFTTRGALSQEFCRHHGLDRATLSGDIAFRDRRFSGRRFEPLAVPRHILVSDPHYEAVYEPLFGRLVSLLRIAFPEAEVECALHGKNKLIAETCKRLGIPVHVIHATPDTGLEIYDKIDLHVGFRVHGHVSALARRKPSYLLEQDGRGCDYGLTLDRRISVPAFQASGLYGKRREQFWRLVKGRPLSRNYVSRAAADIIMALVRRDADRAFDNFVGLETAIEGFNAATYAAIAGALGKNP